MIVRLPFGRDAIAADLRGLHPRVLEPSAPRGHSQASSRLAEALDRPRDGAGLATLARGKRRVAVVVPDATRAAWLPEALPLILTRVAEGGVPTSAVTVLVACGTHPPAAATDLDALLGRLPSGAAVRQHDSRDDARLVAVGSVAGAGEIRLDRAAVEADLLVSVSTVQHHYFAGFGGGPKMIFPGVSGYREIQANHARVLDLSADPPRRHPGCEPGRLAGNPVAEEIAAAATLRPVDLALVMVAGKDGDLAWAEAGALDDVFPAACARVREWYESDAGPFERLVVSGGGSPRDNTLIQAHKALDAACRFASDGAEVVFVAACENGAGSRDMEPFLADPRPEAIIARLRSCYVQYGHTTLRLVEKTARFRVLCRSTLQDDLVRRLGMTPIREVDEVFERWREEGHGTAVAVMPGAPVYPALR